MPGRCPTSGPRGSRAGITFMEVLLVLVLLGLMAGIVAPRIDVARFQVDAGVQEMKAILHTAQRLAVLHQHDVAVTFHQGDGRIDIHLDRNNNGTVDPGEQVRVFELGDGVSFGRSGAEARPLGGDDISFSETGGSPTLTFRRNGAASEEGIVYVSSTRAVLHGDPVTDTHAIEVTRSTGTLRCFSYRSGQWRERC